MRGDQPPDGELPDAPPAAPARQSRPTPVPATPASSRDQSVPLLRPGAGPPVELGRLDDSSLAPAFYVIVERGVARRPALATGLRLEVEIKVDGPYPPVRVSFQPDRVLVEDAQVTDPAVRIQGGLTDLVSLLVAPVGFGGIPRLRRAKGRAAIGKVVLGRVRIEGRLTLIRRLLALIRI